MCRKKSQQRAEILPLHMVLHSPPRARDPNENSVPGQPSTSKNIGAKWALDLSPRYGQWYWSPKTLFWQLSISHNMDVKYQWCTYASGTSLLFFKVWGFFSVPYFTDNSYILKINSSCELKQVKAI